MDDRDLTANVFFLESTEKPMPETTYPLNWDLDSLYPDPTTDAFAEIFDSLKTDMESLAADSEELPEIDRDPEAWGRFLNRLGDLLGRYEDLHSHVGCHAAGDAANKTYQQYEGKLAALDPLWQQTLTNIELGLRELPEDRLPTVVQQDQVLTENMFYLRDRQRNAALRLPKAQEFLAADLSVDAIHAWGRLYDRLSGELRIEVMEKGELVRKSPGQVLWDSKERSVRINNFYAADKAWNTLSDTCADALNHISGFRLTKYRRLGVDHLEAPLRLNRMTRQTLETMWNTISARKHFLLDYFAAKAKLLGLEKLSWFDLQAPLPADPFSVHSAGTRGELTWDEACGTVAKTLGEFSPDFGEFAEQAMRNGWVEAEDRTGKRQGGFCTGFPTRKQTRIFMTFTGSPDSMSTLAHELGHAYHSFVLREQPLLLRDYPMNLAETASTFAEAILGDRRLADAETDHDKRSILDNMCSDAVAFLMNIHCRFLFEDAFHHERANGELSTQRFFELMEDAQKQAYQNALDEEGYYPGFWISKLHFYISSWPFYNFPYTFGYLLSQGIYALSQESSTEFSESYRRFLLATGCMETEEAVESTLGYDLTQPDFWHKCLDIVESHVQEFTALCQ